MAFTQYIGWVTLIPTLLPSGRIFKLHIGASVKQSSPVQWRQVSVLCPPESVRQPAVRLVFSAYPPLPVYWPRESVVDSFAVSSHLGLPWETDLGRTSSLWRSSSQSWEPDLNEASVNLNVSSLVYPVSCIMEPLMHRTDTSLQGRRAAKTL